MEPLLTTPKPVSRKGAYIVAAIAVLGAIAGVVAAVQYHGTYTTLMASSEFNNSLMTDLFAQWKLAYGKSYSSATEEAHKFATFKDNYIFIVNWNSDPTQTSTVGLNEFADLNTQEFKALKSCFNMLPQKKNESVQEEFVGDVSANPASVNWVTAGAVTPIKNQGDCGSCWAFSTTGSLEGLHFLKYNTLLSFSEQQLVDCSSSYGNQGCNGGLMDNAFEYVEAKGIELESTYPYTAVTGTCKYAAAQVQFYNTGYTNVTPKNEVALQTAVVAQPVSIAIEADQPVFQLYTGGVITSASCGTSLDHGVLAVGYSTSGSTPYWLVKNSWGATWGLSGYVWIGRSTSTNTLGICGICSLPSFPTGGKTI